jgi:hypothetical protein
VCLQFSKEEFAVTVEYLQDLKGSSRDRLTEQVKQIVDEYQFKESRGEHILEHEKKKYKRARNLQKNGFSNESEACNE